jgi:cytochrome c biogenesis protein ResB
MFGVILRTMLGDAKALERSGNVFKVEVIPTGEGRENRAGATENSHRGEMERGKASQPVETTIQNADDHAFGVQFQGFLWRSAGNEHGNV